MFGLTGSEANSIAAQKTYVELHDPNHRRENGELYMVVGTPGGSTIITSVFQTILNVYEHGMEMQAAVDALVSTTNGYLILWCLNPILLMRLLVQEMQAKGHTIEAKYSRIIGKVDAIHRKWKRTPRWVQTLEATMLQPPFNGFLLKEKMIEENCIEVQGARVHNLKNIDVKIPRDELVVITRPSGRKIFQPSIPFAQRDNVVTWKPFRPIFVNFLAIWNGQKSIKSTDFPP